MEHNERPSVIYRGRNREEVLTHVSEMGWKVVGYRALVRGDKYLVPPSYPRAWEVDVMRGSRGNVPRLVLG